MQGAQYGSNTWSLVTVK